MSEQMPLFTLGSPDSPLSAHESAVEGDPVGPTPRVPGWTLLGDPDAATNLWHRVAWQRYDGLLFAVCGASGRFIDEHEREIIMCPDCAASA